LVLEYKTIVLNKFENHYSPLPPDPLLTRFLLKNVGQSQIYLDTVVYSPIIIED
jgi:hypothetical protein